MMLNIIPLGFLMKLFIIMTALIGILAQGLTYFCLAGIFRYEALDSVCIYTQSNASYLV